MDHTMRARGWVWALLALVFPAALAAAQLEPPLKEAGWEEASAVLERWRRVQGLDRTAADVFPRSTSQELIPGDAAKGTQLRFVDGGGNNYRLVVELPDGKRYGEIGDGGSHWHLNEVLGNGRLSGTSELVGVLRQTWQTAKTLPQRYAAWRRFPDRERDGKLCQVVGMRPRNGVYEYWWFEAETGSLLVVDTMSNDAKVIGRVRYSDFRMVDGALEPHAIVVGEGSQRSTLKIGAVENRVKLPPGFFAPAKTEYAEWKAAEDVLVKYVKACGGIAALSQITTRVTKSVGENKATGVKFHVTLSQKAPRSYLAETDVEGLGRSLRGFDGETGWELSDLKGFRSLQGPEVELFRRNGQLDTENFPATYPLRKLIGDGQLNGQRVTAIELAMPFARAGTHYFEVESGQLVRVESVVPMGGDGEIKVRIDFSDFRTVDGVTLPYRTSLKNPAMQIETLVESVKQNVELDDAIFKPRKEE